MPDFKMWKKSLHVYYLIRRGSKTTVWVFPKNPNILGSGFFTAEFIEKK